MIEIADNATLLERAQTLEAKLVKREQQRIGIESFEQLERQMTIALEQRKALAEEMLPMPPSETAAPRQAVTPF